MRNNKVLTFIICLAIPLAVGAISGFATTSEIDSWFSTLQKPSFNPPNTIFGPVWTSLYTLMGISLYMIWMSPAGDLRKKALRIFGWQLFFNFWWSIIFFSFHLLFIAIIDILLMWVLIVYMIYLFRKIKPWAGYLNIPYILWVSFATILNISIWWLNK
jgi:benzodiazapine receptor